MTMTKGPASAPPSPTTHRRGAATSRPTGPPTPRRSRPPAGRCSTTRDPGSGPAIGADVVCEALLLQGVDVFFSYPGGVILPLYDVLGDYPELRHVLVRHEQGGAHAADGYARVTGRSGSAWGPPARARRTS
jgi:hypothetical protein